MGSAARSARLAALSLFGATLAAQSVDPWLYVAELRIEGTTAFAPDAIRTALCADPGAVAGAWLRSELLDGK